MASRLTPVTKSGEPRLMITDGGPHPADVWAQVTAEHIMPLGDDISGTRRAAAMAVQAKLMAALEPLYDAEQQAERDRLAADHDALMAPPASNEFVGSAVTAARDALSGTEWAGMMDDAERVAAVRMALAQHHATAVSVERGWHVDRNPDHPHAAAFNAMRGM